MPEVQFREPSGREALAAAHAAIASWFAEGWIAGVERDATGR